MLIKLENDPEFYRQQKEWGMARAELFSWRKTAEQLLDLYREVYMER
jgi:glycosyltransferase involved in cell wall biosynthesis